MQNTKIFLHPHILMMYLFKNTIYCTKNILKIAQKFNIIKFKKRKYY